MVVQSGADNSSMGKIYLPFTNQRRYEHTPVHFLFMCILQIEDAPILLQHTFFILIEFPSQRWAQNYLTQFKIFSWSLVRTVNIFMLEAALLVIRAYRWYIYTDLRLYLRISIHSCVQFVYLCFRRLYLSLVRTVNIIMLEAALLVIRAYS